MVQEDMGLALGHIVITKNPQANVGVVRGAEAGTAESDPAGHEV